MSRAPAGCVQRLDATIDELFETLRGREAPDQVFAIASHLGDWGLIWNFIAVAQGLRSDDDAQRVPRLLTIFAAESLIVNQGIKRLFNRTRPANRPTVSGQLREPLTSSFPSGHASTSACAAVVLTEGDPAMWTVVLPTAAIVSASRVYTRMHHPTDVLAGAVVGLALGLAARRWWPDPHR